jgi:thiol-disulfide isomerase/thioredoxin
MLELRETVAPRFVLILGLLTAVVLVGLSVVPGWFSQFEVGAQNEPALDFWLTGEDRIPMDLAGKLLTVDGEEVTLDGFDYDALFLNFWATWCGPCRAEMPSIASLHDELSKEGLKIIAVTDEDIETVRYFLKHNPYPFTVLIDEQGSLAGRLRIWSVPWTLILDRQGNLVHFHPGARLWDSPEVLNSIDQLINE